MARRHAVLRLIPYGGIGDVILTTPAIRAWKRENPKGRLLVYALTSRKVAEVLRLNPHIDGFRHIPDAAYNVLRSIPKLHDFLMKDVLRPQQFKVAPGLCYEVHISKIIGELIDVPVTDVTPEIYLSADEDLRASRRIAHLRNPVVFSTREGLRGNKAWLHEHWVSLLQQSPDASFVQLGLPNERLVEGAVDMRDLSLRDSFALIKHSAAFIGVDSCWAHAAAAFHVPAVVLFGPSTPKVWGHGHCTNLYAGFRCSPCIDVLNDGTCPYDRACMQALTVNAVAGALRRVMEKS